MLLQGNTMTKSNSGYQQSPILSQATLTSEKGLHTIHIGRVWMRLIAGLLISFAIAFNLYHLLPEVTVQSPRLNDGVLHLLALEGMASALAEGKDPSDFWLGMISLGYPLFHHYQHLAYLPLVVLHWLSGGTLQLSVLFSWTQYLLLSLFPLSIYWSMRRFGFNSYSAALAGLVAPLLAANHLYGFDFTSYVWRGFGLYTQLWGMFLLPPTLAQGHFTLRSGRGYLGALLLLAATLLAHLVSGYIALVSLAVLVLISPRSPAASGGAAQTTSSSDRVTRALRLVLLVLLVVLVTAYFLLPFWLDSAYMNRSVWEKEEKYDSYGYEWVLGALVRGELLDFGRFPWLTILAALGLVRCMWHWRDERYRVPVALFTVWLLFYFGRPTWGVLLDLLPISRDLHFHRLIAGVHLGAILLAGLGLAWFWEWAAARKKITYVLAVAALTFVILYPCYAERREYLTQNAQWLLENHNATAAEERDTADLIATLKSLPPGRVYAGLGNNWGREYRIGFVPMYALLNSAGLDMVGYLYHALSLNADILVHFDESRPEHYNLFNVRYVVAPAEHAFPDFVRPLADFGRHRLYQVETTGYFDIVSTSVAFTGVKDDWYPAASAWLNSPLLRDKEHPAILFRPAPWLGLSQLPLSQAVNILAQFSSLPGSPLGQVRSEVVDESAYSAEVELEHSGMVLLKVTYHPNWHATLNGVETATVMLMPGYVGVPVPSGVHQVHLEYRPGQLRKYLLLISLLTICIVALAQWRHKDVTQMCRLLGLHQPGLGVWPTLSEEHRTYLGIYLLLLAIYLMSAAGHFFSTDHVAIYMTVQSLIERGTLAIDPINDAVLGIDGRYYAVFGLGQSLLSIPFYLAGILVERLSSPALRAYWSGPALGQWGGTVPIFFVSLFNQFVCPLICVLVYAFVRRLTFGRQQALAVSLMLACGTLMWSQARDSFQHPLQTLFLLLAIYILFAYRGRMRIRHCLLSGGALGLGVLVRIDLLFVMPLLVGYLVTLVLHRDQSITKGEATAAEPTRGPLCAYLLAFAAPVALALLIHMFINYLKFGDYLVLRPGITPEWWVSPLTGLYGYLFSPGRSIFLYSPPLILSLYSFLPFYRRYQREAILIGLISIIYLILFSSYSHWHGDWCWGPRHLLLLVPLWSIPLAFVLTSRRWIALAAGLTALGLGVQILGVTINWSFVHWDWIRMGLVPADAHLFHPEISAIPMHLNTLLAGRYVDLRLFWVYQQYEVGVFVVTLAFPLCVLYQGLQLLIRR